MLELQDLPERTAYLNDAGGPFWERFPTDAPDRAVRFGDGVLLLRFDDCRAAFADKRLVQGNLDILERDPSVDPRFVERRRHAILDMEGVDHVRLRRLAMPALSPDAVAGFRAHMRRIMTELIDQVVDEGRTEAVATFCRPYPVPVICAILGVPDDDIDFFSDCAEAWTTWIRKGVSAVPEAMAAHDAMDDYLTRLVERRRNEPGDDLLTGLIRAEEDGDRLSAAEVIHLVAGLIVAGTDTTRHMLANALYLFATRPDDWARLAGDEALALRATEEVLRYAPVGPMLRRLAIEDVELSGLRIPKGATAFIAVATANRDPEIFPDPNVFSIDRETPRAHFSFAAGRKHCLGAHLARAELQEAISLLAQRLPNLRLDGEPVWQPPSAFQGPLKLPLAWG